MQLSLKELTKSYSSLRVLDGVNLDFPPGAITVLLGANGAGKTTLLRCLSGLSSGESGGVFMDGERLEPGRLDLRRRMIFLPDFPPPLPATDLLEHVALHLRLWEKNRPGVEDRVVQWMEKLDLINVSSRHVSSLSRGQRYKAALLSLLAVDPELWLLDEPFASGMDARGIAVLRREAQKAAQRGHTVIYSTQVVELAATFSGTTATIRDGHVMLYDTEAEFARDPRRMEERLFFAHQRPRPEEEEDA